MKISFYFFFVFFFLKIFNNRHEIAVLLIIRNKMMKSLEITRKKVAKTMSKIYSMVKKIWVEGKTFAE